MKRLKRQTAAAEPVKVENVSRDSTGAGSRGPADSGNRSQGQRPVLRVGGLRKQFRRRDGNTVHAVNDVSLTVVPGEFVVLLGPSGCGKTTLLRCVAGLEEPDEGRIEVGGDTVFDAREGRFVPPEHRSLGMIFQSYALWPHMTAFQNVAYPLQCLHMRKREIGPQVAAVLETVGIPELTSQYPAQMSGGQQQRVALARALVAEDQLLLFDEPLSNVDAKVREELRLELLTMQRRLGFAALYVTHDQAEAMELADKIAVIRDGRIVQLGTPQNIYEEPTTRYVANFIGSTNELSGTVEDRDATDGMLWVSTRVGRLKVVPTTSVQDRGSSVTLVFRPERCTVSAARPEGVNRWSVEVDAVKYLGGYSEYILTNGDNRFRAWQEAAPDLTEGSPVWVSVQPRHVRALGPDEATASLSGER